MKKYIFGCLLTLATLFFAMPDVMAQPIKLHEQPESTVPNDNDACYSQERTGIDGKKYFLKFKFSTLKRFFGLKTGAGQLSYIPAASGNPAGDCNKIVIGSNGKQYIIDALGNATQLQAGANYTAGPGITINNSAIAAKDSSATNELQVLSQNALGDSIVLSKGGGRVAYKPQVNADWNATSGASEIFNKPAFPAALLYKQGLQRIGDSVHLGGSVTNSRRIDFSTGDSGGELLLEGGKTKSSQYGDIKFPIRLQELYDPNAPNYERGVGIQFYSKDTTSATAVNSAIFNYDGALTVQTDGGLSMYGSQANIVGSGGVFAQSNYASWYMSSNNQQEGILSLSAFNGAGSGSTSTVELKGGIGNNSYLKLDRYPRTRVDSSQIKNFLFTDATGVLRSRPIADLGATLSGSVSNGLTSINGNTQLGGTVANPATVDNERQITFLPAGGGYASGRLILKEGQKSSSSGFQSDISYPLLLATDKINNGTNGVGLLFRNSFQNGSNVIYDGLSSKGDMFHIASTGANRSLSITSNGSIDTQSKSVFMNTYDTLGGFRQYHSVSNSHTQFDKQGFNIRIVSDTFYYGKINGYGNTNNYLCLSNYKNTRNDTGSPVNVLTTDARGVVQSHPASELPGTSVSGVYDLTININGGIVTSKAFYTKIGNMVTVSFSASFNVSSISAITLVNLPYARSSLFSNTNDVKGSVNISNRSASNVYSNALPCVIISQGLNARVEWTTALAAGSGAIIQGQFMYEITPSY
jgi:hypothetical protein